MPIRILTATFVLLLSACGGQNDPNETAASLKFDYSVSSIHEFNNLGWLGVMSHPLMESVSFQDPENDDVQRSPGGIVVREIISAAPADAAGLKVGDVIVGVGKSWLPINDDPTLDFIQLLESEVTLNPNEIELQILRNGKRQIISIATSLESLDEGQPDQVARFSENTTRGLTFLASLQNEDGSFGQSNASFDVKTQLTAIAGLSFLAAGDDQFNSNGKKCVSFIGAQIDSLIEQSKTEESKSNAAPSVDSKASKLGMMIMTPASFDIDPLTAAYLLSLFAESDVQMMDAEWMQRVLGVIGSLSKSQHESGGWAVSDDADSETIDIAGTHTTNQVVLAMGMIERKGMMNQSSVISKACRYLKNQSVMRSSGTLDRRLKKSLSAGTAAALISINCKKTDPDLGQWVSEGLEQPILNVGSPSLKLSGILSVALLARQTGNDNWSAFFAATKYWLTSVQLPDGSFKSIADSNSKPLELETHASDPAWTAAHYCLLLSMQSSHLKKMTGLTKSPMMIARNSSGEKSSGGNETTPAGMQMSPGATTTFQLDDLSGEGSLEDQIKEKLKKMGVSTDNMQIQNLGGAKKKKDKAKDK